MCLCAPAGMFPVGPLPAHQQAAVCRSRHRRGGASYRQTGGLGGPHGRATGEEKRV